MSPKKTTKKTTKAVTKVSFREALDHGKARHSVGPWKFDLANPDPMRRFEKGRPSVGDNGAPEMARDGGLKLIWMYVSREEALEKWDSEGWILEE